MKEIVMKALQFVKEYFKDVTDGSEYYHAERVYRKAMHLAKEEKANNFVVALAAILHGVEPKNNRRTKNCPTVRAFLESFDLDKRIIDIVIDIICNIDFENRKNNNLRSIEHKVVFDANLLDSIGAVGIARNFAYGGYHKINMYDGNISNENMIKVFYERLLTAKDYFQTFTGKQLAVRRHEFMERFLQEFYFEWNV